MKVKEAVEKVEKDTEFKRWHKKNSKSYLAHVFKIVDEVNGNIWQVGYYNEDGTVTTFLLEGEDLKMLDAEEIFQKEKKKVHRLDLTKVKFDIDEALEIAKKFQEENVKGNDAAKIMLILQNVAGHIIYNITYITLAFNTLNMKIDAANKKVISHELTPMLQFQGKAS